MDGEPILSTEADNTFRPLRTVPAFSLHLLISAMISLAGIVMAASWSDERRCDAYFTMLYLRAIFWLFTFIFDHYAKHQHEQLLRLRGYHNFHRATAQQKNLPLLVVTLWNVAISAIQTLMQQYYGEHFGEHCIAAWLSPLVYVTLFSSFETVVLGLVHGAYIVRVNRFNRLEPVPDALQGDRMQQVPGALTGDGQPGGSVGLTQPAADLHDLLEKQADLITYLRDRNQMLDQKLMQLNIQLRTGSQLHQHA